MPDSAHEANCERCNLASKWLLFASWTAFATCLYLPAQHGYVTGSQADDPGFKLFLMGIMGFFAGNFTWLANPALLFAWLTRSSNIRGLSLMLAVVAFAIAASYPLSETMAGRGAGLSHVVGSGYYMWLLSIALAGGSALLAIQPRTVLPDPPGKSEDLSYNAWQCIGQAFLLAGAVVAFFLVNWSIFFERALSAPRIENLQRLQSLAFFIAGVVSLWAAVTFYKMTVISGATVVVAFFACLSYVAWIA